MLRCEGAGLTRSPFTFVSYTRLPSCSQAHSSGLCPLIASKRFEGGCRRSDGTLVRSAANSKQPAKQNKATVYPAGRKQASIRLPAFVLKLDSGQVLGQLPRLEETLTQAIAGGLNGVLLSDSPSSTGASLYEAASTLKELLRGRATLLVTDRIDIVDAADADGVLLTPRGNYCSASTWHSLAAREQTCLLLFLEMALAQVHVVNA